MQSLLQSQKKKISDDPEFAGCSCKRLFQRKNVTSVGQDVMYDVTRVASTSLTELYGAI